MNKGMKREASTKVNPGEFANRSANRHRVRVRVLMDAGGWNGLSKRQVEKARAERKRKAKHRRR